MFIRWVLTVKVEERETHTLILFSRACINGNLQNVFVIRSRHHVGLSKRHLQADKINASYPAPRHAHATRWLIALTLSLTRGIMNDVKGEF